MAGPTAPLPAADDARTAELAGNLGRVRERLDAACRAADRDPSGLTLVAVTKTFPAEDVCRLATLGVTEIGENRDQEAADKAARVRDAGVSVHWHFVGRLQRNKARHVAGYADVVHSVDRPALADALEAGAAHHGRALDVLLQVSLDADPRRGGVPPADLAALADQVGTAPHLHLTGVMAVAPQNVDPDAAFATLAEVAAELRSAHPEALAVSAGMSGDLEAAVRHGATHVRIGTALLGGRAKLVR